MPLDRNNFARMFPPYRPQSGNSYSSTVALVACALLPKSTVGLMVMPDTPLDDVVRRFSGYGFPCQAVHYPPKGEGITGKVLGAPWVITVLRPKKKRRDAR